MSNRIATLERELGVRLFERDLRNVSLTQHGQRALSQAEAIVRMVDEFERSICEPAHMRGTVLIGTVDSIVHAWLPQLIERVKVTYPNVSVDMTVDTSLNIARLIQDGQIDLGLIMGPIVAPHIRNIELCSFECQWFASPALELSNRPITLADIAQHPIFGYSKGSQPHQALMRLVEQSGLDARELRIFNSNSLATTMRLIRDGVGVALLPPVVVREYIERGELTMLETNARLPHLHFHAVYADNPGNALPSLIAAMAAEVAAA